MLLLYVNPSLSWQDAEDARGKARNERSATEGSERVDGKEEKEREDSPLSSFPSPLALPSAALPS